jgi:hypothetical protein
MSASRRSSWLLVGLGNTFRVRTTSSGQELKFLNTGSASSSAFGCISDRDASTRTIDGDYGTPSGRKSQLDRAIGRQARLYDVSH